MTIAPWITYGPKLVESEVWFRNPNLYIRECLEVGVELIAWDRGFLHKHTLDPVKFMSLYYQGQPWRQLIIDEDCAVEVRPGFTQDRPAAVYPSWSYGEDISVLEELMEQNVADDESACIDENTPANRRPVPGQEHRVVVTNLPIGTTNIGRKFYRVLRELQDEHPEVILHVHGLYSYRIMFGLGYRSVDAEPRELAKKGKVTLPNGLEVSFEKASESPQWITLLGMSPVDLKIPRNRCMYNIRSTQWAAKHFRENVRFKHNGFSHINPDDPTTKLPSNNFIFMKRISPREGDKYLCDACSLQVSCKYFRTGAICAVPDSEPQELATFFATRDADTIINGLGTVLAAQARRATRGMERESENDDKLDPEVSKLLDNVFNNGVKLAKLVNPALNGAKGPAINFNTLNLGNSPPQAIMAQIMDALEAGGIPRDQITPEMVKQVFAQLQPGDTPQQAAIDVASVQKSA